MNKETVNAEVSIESMFESYAVSRDERERNEIVSRNLYIAEILAKKMSGRGVEYDDLLQVASLALIRAVERFDVSKGLKFSTFATPSILGELKNYFRDKSRLIRMGRKSGTVLMNVKKSIAKLTNELYRAPTSEEIAEDTGYSVEDVIEAMELSTHTVSLDSTIVDSETSLYEVIPDKSNPFEALEDREALYSAIRKLTPEEQRLIHYRFYESKSQTELARMMGVSQMYISRMERKILQKLKNMFEKA